MIRFNEKLAKKLKNNINILKIKKNKPIKKIMLINFKEQETIPLNARASILEVRYLVSLNFFIKL